jgi:ubiquinone/menaquinone biosynthesis C-methylase UbiE
VVFDEALAERLDAMYRTADMVRRRELMHAALAAGAGERILDVGCGPGFYVAELLDRVGPGGAVAGIDSSAPMLALARRRCAGRDNVDFHQADALSLPVADASFDAALCVQVLEYLPDPLPALREMRRALRTGGRVVVWDIDWSTVSWYSASPDRMRRVLRVWDTHKAHPSLPRTLTGLLRNAGFTGVRAAGHSFVSTGLDPQTFAGAVVPLIEEFVADRDGVTAAELTGWTAEQRELDARGDFFFSCTQFCFTATC